MILPKLFQPLTQRSILPANRVTDLVGNMWKWQGQVRAGRAFCISDYRMLRATMYLKLNHVQSGMPVVGLFTPDIKQMILSSITFFPKLFKIGLPTCRYQLIMLMGRLMTKSMNTILMRRVRCTTRESALLIAMIPTPLNCILTPTNQPTLYPMSCSK